MPIVNLTGETIRLARENGEVYQTLEPVGARLSVHARGEHIEIEGIPIETTVITAVDGLPDPQPGTYFIVPQGIVQTLQRSDLVEADTGPSAVRNRDGSVYAVRRLFRLTNGRR